MFVPRSEGPPLRSSTDNHYAKKLSCYLNILVSNVFSFLVTMIAGQMPPEKSSAPNKQCLLFPQCLSFSFYRIAKLPSIFTISEIIVCQFFHFETVQDSSSGVFSLLNFAEACKKSSRWLWKD